MCVATLRPSKDLSMPVRIFEEHAGQNQIDLSEQMLELLADVNVIISMNL
jgi:hypothetical protein